METQNNGAKRDTIISPGYLSTSPTKTCQLYLEAFDKLEVTLNLKFFLRLKDWISPSLELIELILYQRTELLNL